MKKQIFFGGLSILLVFVTAASLLLTPAATKSRRTAIPAHAHVVYNSQSAERFLSVFPSLGTLLRRDAQDFPGLGKNEGAEFQGLEKEAGPDLSTRDAGALQLKSGLFKAHGFQWLEKRPLTVATVSFGGRGRRDTWVAVSELGAPAALALRWRLALFPPEGVSPARPYAVWPIWKFEHPSLPSWARVRFTITESLLICSVSGDSHDMYRLLNVADGRAASLVKR
jgi:hypothetical protein